MSEYRVRPINRACQGGKSKIYPAHPFKILIMRLDKVSMAFELIGSINYEQIQSCAGKLNYYSSLAHINNKLSTLETDKFSMFCKTLFIDLFQP